MTSLAASGGKLLWKKCHLRRLWVVFLPNGFKQGSQNFKHLSATISLTHLPHMTSLAVPGRLQNAIKYCKLSVKQVRLAKSRIIRRLFNLESPNKYYMDIKTHLVRSPTRYDVTSYFRLAIIEVRKNGQKCSLRQLWLEF